VILAAHAEDEHLRECLNSIRRNAPEDTAVVHVEPSTAAVNRALEELAPADAIVLEEPCLLTPGWIERLRAGAHADTNTATVSAIADAGTPLALSEQRSPDDELAALAQGLAERTLTLRPRLGRAVGPCVYVRREAIELVGALDEQLDLRSALELDFAQRCVLAGLTHVAADDVLVAPLSVDVNAPAPEISGVLRERYPHLSLDASPMLSESSVLARALEAVRAQRSRLWVTVDARALDGARMGTQIHVLELILALARTGELRLRLLVRGEMIDGETFELLSALPDTEVLTVEEIAAGTPKSTIFHRPQQAFSPGDVALAAALGARVVVSQLDLIAYRNPGYFADTSAWEDYRRASRHGISIAERVVVFSEHTRIELLSDALVDDERIRVVPPGLDHRAAGQARRPAALEEDPPQDGFLLCLGTDFQHKNRVFALRLLDALRERHDWHGSLLLAGTHISHGSSLELERAYLEAHPQLQGAIMELGAIDEQEKAWLLAHAGAVVYPSVYEGFGLVPFESALSGVPCVFAPQASLADAAPEGTATILPWDPERSAAAAYALLTDADVRARHVQSLADAARKLTWASAASAMVEVYREAAVAPVRDAATLSRDMVARELELTSEHAAVVEQLIGERVHAQRMYGELSKEVGFGLSLIGPHGTLPENLQRALLALSARPALSRPLFGVLAQAFRLARATGRLARRLGGGS
jgi:glycosyltransferase involved in cell wall biosynthesis